MSTATLADVASITMGQSPPGETCGASPIGDPLLNGPSEFKTRYPVPAQWTTAATRRAEPGDVLLCVRGSTTGRMNRADQRYAIGRGVGAIRGASPIDTDYIDYALRCTMPELLATTSGSVFPNLSIPDIRAHQIPWPESSIRQQVVAVLGVMDEKIGINEHALKLTRELLQSEFEKLVEPLADIAVARPAGWGMASLGEWLEVLETGKRPPGGVARYTDGVPSLGAESIVSLAAFDFSKTRFVPVEFFSSMSRGVAEDFDVLLYKDGGKPGEFEPHVSMLGEGFPFLRFCINEHVYRVRAKSPLTQEYVYCWLSSEPIMDEMRRRGTGVAIPGLNSTAVKSLPIAVPPVDSLTAFSDIARPLVRLALGLARESRRLAELRDALMPPLLSGELKLRDAGRSVGEAV